MVNRNFALWKTVLCKSPKGGRVAVAWGITIDKACKGTLLQKILAMPKKHPITFDEAINVIVDKKEEAFRAKDYGMRPGQYGWYIYNFVGYISDLGYHIELTGDEIEPIGVSEIRT